VIVKDLEDDGICVLGAYRLDADATGMQVSLVPRDDDARVGRQPR
jgi:hypothetical protein